MWRKRPRAAVALMVLSVVLGLMATGALRGHLARLEARAREPGDLVPVVTAGADLPRGTVITADMLVSSEVPSAYVPPGAVRAPEEAVGRTLAADVTSGEVLTAVRLARAGPVAALVPAGLRAVPVTAAFPPGLIAPGDRVDVLSIAAGAPFAETVAAGAEVLLVADAERPEGLGPITTVVLLVSPGVAAGLARARTIGELTLVVSSGEASRPS